MDRKDILARIGTVIEESAAEEVDWTGVTEETAIESFGLNSLSVLDLLFDLEEEFGIEVSAEDILKMKTTGEMVTLVTDRMTA